MVGPYWEKCALCLEYGPRPHVLETEGTVFPNRDRPRPVNNIYISYKRNSRLCRSGGFTNGSKNVLKLNMQRRSSIPNGNTKISRRRPLSVDDAEFGHSTLLFSSRGRQRNVQRFITHVHRHCFFSLNLSFGDVLVAFVDVVSSLFLMSLLHSVLNLNKSGPHLFFWISYLHKMYKIAQNTKEVIQKFVAITFQKKLCSELHF